MSRIYGSPEVIMASEVKVGDKIMMGYRWSEVTSIRHVEDRIVLDSRLVIRGCMKEDRLSVIRETR